MTKEIKIDLLNRMLKIRRFEEKIIELYPEQEMRTPVHLYIGQEAIAAGVCANLGKEDYVFSPHRNHGHYIAKGADISLLAAELYGKSSGCSSGKGGSMHPVAKEFGMLGASAIVGSTMPLAAGSALASKMRRDGRVSVAFFGDGASEEGTFHESLSFAALKKLPVVFICENNFYATSSHISARQPNDNISKRALGYNMPGFQVDGNDVIAVYDMVNKVIDSARKNLGPSLVECRTYRWRCHVGPECDHERGWRPKAQLEEWMKKCPIKLFKAHLFENGLMTETGYNNLLKKIDNEIEAAFKFGKKSAFPDKSEAFNDVYFGGS